MNQPTHNLVHIKRRIWIPRPVSPFKGIVRNMIPWVLEIYIVSLCPIESCMILISTINIILLPKTWVQGPTTLKSMQAERMGAKAPTKPILTWPLCSQPPTKSISRMHHVFVHNFTYSTPTSNSYFNSRAHSKTTF